MCITNEVKVIVMTTRTMERQRMKCAQYWPLQLNSQLNFAYLTLVNNEMHQFQDYVISRLTLTNNKVCILFSLRIALSFFSYPSVQLISWTFFFFPLPPAPRPACPTRSRTCSS